jgi:hypothetical protein
MGKADIMSIGAVSSSRWIISVTLCFGIYIHDSLNSGFLFGAFNLEAKFEISSIHCSRKLREQKTKILHFCELLSLWIDTGRGITMRAISGNLNEITSVLNKPINRDNRRRVTLLTVKAYR